METSSTPADALVGGPCECPVRRRTSCGRRIKDSWCKGAQHENITKAPSVFLASPSPSITKTGLDPNSLVLFVVVAPESSNEWRIRNSQYKKEFTSKASVSCLSWLVWFYLTVSKKAERKMSSHSANAVIKSFLIVTKGLIYSVDLFDSTC